MQVIAFTLVLLSSFHLDSRRKEPHVRMIVQYADTQGQDPYELLAIALTESDLNPRAVSWAGAIGLFQVMCKYWTKSLGYHSRAQCSRAMLDPQKSVRAGVHVLTHFRTKYAQCKGDFAYRCYYAGQNWPRQRGAMKRKIERYEKKVRLIRATLRRLHYTQIESYR